MITEAIAKKSNLFLAGEKISQGEAVHPGGFFYHRDTEDHREGRWKLA